MQLGFEPPSLRTQLRAVGQVPGSQRDGVLVPQFRVLAVRLLAEWSAK